MKPTYMKVNEVTKLTGVTARTLHYYDQIGLLCPAHVAESGYRYYTEEDLELLQQILFYRELEFSLKEIRDILSHPHYDKHQALKQQKELLRLKKERLGRLMDLIDQQLKGEHNMSFNEFDMKEIEEVKEKYAQEASERWGDSDAFKESQKRAARYTAEDWVLIQGEMNTIFAGFADIRKEDPCSEKAMELVKRWQDHITKYSYECTAEILAGLGLMYEQDERFAKNIDKAGEGTALFMSKAIAAYCAK